MNALLKQCLVAAFAVTALLAGCKSQLPDSHPNPLTFQRGQQLLAAGNPKSAIPLLTQTIASMPDGPEPVALLSLAYALDLQPERALIQAGEVRRLKGSRPGWELVAVAVAQMTEHHPDEAVQTLIRLRAANPANSPLALAAQQWLVRAHTLNRDPVNALATIQTLAQDPQMQTTALLGITLLQAQQHHTQPAADALVACAKLAVTDSGKRALLSDLASADEQTRYDAAIAAVASADLPAAARLFEQVRLAAPLESDAPVWLALIASVNQNWQTGRALLKDACDKGSSDSLGLANQLFALVCAIEDRPDDMIETTLSGQRLLGRSSTPAYIVDQPKPEPVWFSDAMK